MESSIALQIAVNTVLDFWFILKLEGGLWVQPEPQILTSVLGYSTVAALSTSRQFFLKIEIRQNITHFTVGAILLS